MTTTSPLPLLPRNSRDSIVCTFLFVHFPTLRGQLCQNAILPSCWFPQERQIFYFPVYMCSCHGMAQSTHAAECFTDEHTWFTRPALLLEKTTSNAPNHFGVFDIQKSVESFPVYASSPISIGGVHLSYAVDSARNTEERQHTHCRTYSYVVDRSSAYLERIQVLC